MKLYLILIRTDRLRSKLQNDMVIPNVNTYKTIEGKVARSKSVYYIKILLISYVIESRCLEYHNTKIIAFRVISRFITNYNDRATG